MSYCSNCGNQVDDTMRFCPNCGKALTADAEAMAAEQTAAASSQPTEAPAQPASTTAQPTTVNIYQTTANPSGAYSWATSNGLSDYSLILVSRGSCSKSTARSIIRDILGYTWMETLRIVNNTPMEIAHSMSLQQVVDLSRVLTEYGMQVAVYNSTGYVNLGSYATSSALNSQGSFLQSVATTLATLSVANRVNRLLKWSLSSPMQYLFMPKYRYVRPVRYIRPTFSLFGPPRPPRPTPRPFFSLFGSSRPTPKPTPRPTPRPAPRPSSSRPTFSLFGGLTQNRKSTSSPRPGAAQRPASTPRPSAPQRPTQTPKPSSSRPGSSSRPLTPGGFGRGSKR